MNLYNEINEINYLLHILIFIKYVSKKYDLNKKDIKICFIYDPKYSEEIRSYGGFNFVNHEISVVLINRSLADSMRTLAHELWHLKQKLDGRLVSIEDGKTGSDIENEANSKAGIIMRDFGKEYPKIYNLKM